MDVIWAQPRTTLLNLSDVDLTFLTVPLANAAEEQVFSIIRKNKTEFRSRLDATSLNTIVVVKMSNSESLLPCYRWKPTKKFIKSIQKNLQEIQLKVLYCFIFLKKRERGLTI